MSEAWLKPALLGVQRRADFAIDGELGDLLAQIANDDDAALAFGRSASAMAACTLAAVRLDAAGDLPPPSPDEPRALSTRHRWAPVLESLFAPEALHGGHAVRLRHEACTVLARDGATLPFAVLPQALAAGARSQPLRAVLLSVLGARGRWLAARNPDWKYAAVANAGPTATDGADRIWQEGQHVERLAYFDALRASDPQAARALLQSSLDELAARERAAFVAALAANLGPGDEPLLEALLKDRSRDVRGHAALLLAQLPDSAHARRLIGWIQPLVTPRRGLLGKGWDCDAPQAAEPGWSDAAIEAKRPQHEALGERAWWLYQLVRQVPLSWWTSRTGSAPPQLIAWAAKTDWKDALLRGWRERVRGGEPDWIDALLSLRQREMRAHAPALLALLPAAQRERYWPRTVAELDQANLLGDVVGACALGETLSPGYSRDLLASLHACFAEDRLRHDYGLRAHLPELAALLHPDALRDARAVPRRADETPAMAGCAQEFERIVLARTVLHSPIDRLTREFR